MKLNLVLLLLYDKHGVASYFGIYLLSNLRDSTVLNQIGWQFYAANTKRRIMNTTPSALVALTSLRSFRLGEPLSRMRKLDPADHL